MATSYHRPWPLWPAVNRAIRDHRRDSSVDLDAVQDELDRWYVIWIIVCVSVVVVAIIASAIGG